MPRPLRLDYPGARHHVMNRGARQQPVFLTDADCAAFLDLLGETAARFAVRVHGYALMSDHFHLLLSTPRGNLSAAMSWLQSRFSRHQNLVHSWDGPVWRGRYKNRLVEDEAYWRHLLAYVHLNPVAAHLVGSPDRARWTSHCAYLGVEEAPPWLDTAELLDLFGGAEGLDDYVYDVQVGRERGPDGFDEARLWRRDASLPIGSEPPPEAPRNAELALAEVALVTGRSEAEVRRSTLGPGGNRARLLAMWWLHEGAGLGTSAVARTLGVDPAVASRGVRRAGRQADAEFLGWCAALRARAAGGAVVTSGAGQVEGGG